MTDTDDKSARTEILEVTIRLLLEHDPEAITVRQIASQAGVNVAAINYYFRSKENLIGEAVLSATATAFSQGMTVLTNKTKKPKERLFSFFDGYAKGLVEFKGITLTAFRGFLMRAQGSDGYAGFLKELLEATAAAYTESGMQPKAALKKALWLYSGVAFPFLVMGSLRQMAGFDYSDPSARREYIKFLVETSIGRKE